MQSRRRLLSIEEAANALGMKPRVVRYYLEKGLLKGCLVTNASGASEWNVYPTARMLATLREQNPASVDDATKYGDQSNQDWRKIALQLQEEVHVLQDELLMAQSFQTQRAAEHVRQVEDELSILRNHVQELSLLRKRVKQLEEEQQHALHLLDNAALLKEDLRQLQECFKRAI